MPKPDLLICWIKHADYPLFRATLRKHRDFFGRIIIYWSEHFRDIYFDKFIQEDLDDLGDIVFLDNIDYKYGVEDWRNVATNYMLKYADSEWVCSVEQDWFSKDWDQLLTMVTEAMQTNDLVGWGATSGAKQFYIHPAFWFIKRELLDQTTKDFSARDGEDHFGWITRDVEQLGAKIFCIDRDGGLNCSPDPTAHSFHLGGVNQNYLEGLKPDFVFHRPEAFMVYNFECRWTPTIAHDPRFLALSQDIEAKLMDIVGPINLNDNPWTPFFKYDKD